MIKIVMQTYATTDSVFLSFSSSICNNTL